MRCREDDSQPPDRTLLRAVGGNHDGETWQRNGIYWWCRGKRYSLTWPAIIEYLQRGGGTVAVERWGRGEVRPPDPQMLDLDDFQRPAS